jgi:TRAP-type uncharacterized transport system fused permease subunit
VFPQPNIILFVFFGTFTFLNASGAGKLLIDTSLAIAGRFSGGAAKTAVIASALMGTMSGSPIANAVTTGTITIPLMKESGFNKDMACAVESTASTGGMLMPPVMGAAAFVMAECLHVDYATIMKAAFLPALVFFASVYFTIDFYSRKHRLGASLQKSERAAETFRKAWNLIIPIVCLIVFLMYRISPMTSVVYCPTLGGLKPPPFRRQLQHFFFFTFGSYYAYGNTWSARPSSKIS